MTMTLNLEEFLTLGEFSVLGSVPHREKVRAILGPPDDQGVGKNSNLLWRYGPVEFHFSQEGKTKLIYVDHFHMEFPRIDLWFFQSGITMTEVIEGLRAKALGFSIDGENTITTEKGIVIDFFDSGAIHALWLEFESPTRKKQISLSLDHERYSKLRKRSEESRKSMSEIVAKIVEAEIDQW
ncbi:hypothetical protein FRD01_16685 [Microvenator marinus]|uniref:Uncharacterized protein n=1 Tax=Microvenator marinus TaxID=2600177 RepID=A0A5B8XYW1_9DELT|nr:hypothetical protein [Microvenator marinus]QED28846.1 hypothetical protein FRD01_16685 [Microvenator marinus]